LEGIKVLNPLITYILDTSAILAIQQIFSFVESDTDSSPILLTSNEIISEFIDDFSKFRIRSMLSSEELKAVSPTMNSLNVIEKECTRIGNQSKLSSQDKSVIAIAWQELRKEQGREVIILTDDYEIQNTAYMLGISYKPIRTKGISYSVKFRRYCGDCKSQLNQKAKECENCGSFNIKTKKIKKKIKNQT